MGTDAEGRFRITGSRGFKMTFANGWTVSVQFGPGNYCDNRHLRFDEEERAGREGSATAEMAAWGPDGEWYDFGDDTVRGWQSPDDVLAFMGEIAAKPTTPSDSPPREHEQVSP